MKSVTSKPQRTSHDIVLCGLKRALDATCALLIVATLFMCSVANAEIPIKKQEQFATPKSSLLPLLTTEPNRTTQPSITLPFDGIEYNFRLTAIDVLTRGAKVLSVTDAGEQISAPPVRHFKGESPDGHTVRLSLMNTGQKVWLHALADLGDKRVSFKASEENNEFVTIEALQQDPEAVSALLRNCGIEDDTAPLYSAMLAPEPALAGETVLFRAAALATEADYEWTLGAGSAANANAEIQAIVNQVNGLTEAQLGIRLFIVHQRAYSTANDPYSGNGDAMLTELSDRLSVTQTHGTFFDYAQLFTGRDIISNSGNPSVIGLANQSACCSYSGVSVVERRNGEAQRNVSAHELGHLFGAYHDESYSHVMSPYANSSDYYSAESIASIQSVHEYRDDVQVVTRQNLGPRIPRNLTVYNRDLRWDAPDGGAMVDYYEVFRSSTPTACEGTPHISNVGGEWAVDRSAILGVTSYYSVHGVNARGPGPCLGPITPSPASPVTALNVVDTSTLTNLSLRLSWSGARTGDQYKIFRATSPSVPACSGTPYVQIGDDNSFVNNFDDTNVSQGTRYYYSVQRLNYSVAPSCSAVASLAPPTAGPALSIDFMNSSSVGLRWSSGTFGVQRYLVKRALATQTDPSAFSTIIRLEPSPGIMRHTDTTANLDGTIYRYEVDGCNVSGCQSSNQVEGSCLVLPSEPRNVTASQGTSGQIQIAWASPLRGTPQQYRVYASTTGPAGPFSQISLSSSLTYSTLYTPSTSADHHFVVRAENQVGLGPQSSSALGWALKAPTNFLASPGYYSDRIALRWDVARGATGYLIERTVVATSAVLSSITISSGNVSSYDDSSAPANTDIRYNLSTIRNQFSSSSTIATGSRVTSQPTVVQNVNASDGSSPSNVAISWSHPPTRPQSYNLYRSNTNVGCVGTPIQNVNALYDSVSDSTAVAGVTYFYSVQSVFANGFLSNCSATNAGYRALAYPASFTGSYGNPANISLSWSSVPHASQYNLYRSTSSPVSCTGTPFATRTTLTFVDTSALPSIEYSYGVSGVGANGLPGPCATAVGLRGVGSSSSSSSSSVSSSSSSQSSSSSSSSSSMSSSSASSSSSIVSSSSASSSSSSQPSTSSSSSSASSQSSSQSSSVISQSSTSSSSSISSSISSSNSSSSSTSVASSSASSLSSSSLSSSSQSSANAPAPTPPSPLLRSPPALRLKGARSTKKITVQLPKFSGAKREVILERIERGRTRVAGRRRTTKLSVSFTRLRTGNYVLSYRILSRLPSGFSSTSRKLTFRLRKPKG